MKKNTFIGGAIILTAAGLISRILGFIYRIYLSNLIGSEGMGLFQLIFPLFSVVYMISSSGTFVGISKLVSQESAKGSTKNMNRVLKIGAIFSLLVSLICSVIFFFGADFISSSIIKEPRTMLAIKILSFAFPFCSLNTSIKAYFYGKKEMIIPASSQILEQIVRMTVIFIAADFFIQKGLVYACVLTVIGIIASEIFSFIHVYFCYKHSSLHTNYSNKKNITPITSLFKKLTYIVIPITANKTFTSILMSFECIIIPIKLQAFGMTNSAAMSLYGQLTGMALPLIFFPSILTNSLSISLLSTISEAKAVKNIKKISFTISKSLQLTSLISILSISVFLTYHSQLGMSLYNEPNVGNILLALAFICPFIYFRSTVNGILNGLSLHTEAFIHNVIGLTIRILIILFFIPEWGIKAYFIGLFISMFLVFILNISKITKNSIIHFKTIDWLIKPSLAALCGSLISNAIGIKFLFPYYSLKFSLLICIAILCITFLFFIITLRCITKDDFTLIFNNKTK